jgi:hypothetical protein
LLAEGDRIQISGCTLAFESSAGPVTERVWQSSRDARSLLGYLRGRAVSERKLRLFAAACGHWSQPRFGKPLDLPDAWEAAAESLRMALEVSSYRVGNEGIVKIWSRLDLTCASLSTVLRCLFGNPFRPTPPLPAAVLHWHDGIVKGLAEQAYQHRLRPSGQLDPQRLAVLADALEEAGCDDPYILDHLRSPGPHYHGCHVFDALLDLE